MDYYKQYITESDAMHARGEPMPSYREYLEGQLAIVEVKVQKCEEEQAAQARYLLEFVDRLWKALGIGGDWQTVPFAANAIEERVTALEAEVSVYRIMHLPTVNVDAGQEGD